MRNFSLGILARDTVTGLGSQSLEVHHNLTPDVTVVVNLGPHAQTPSRRDWYPDRVDVEWQRDRTLPGAYEALKDCDVVWSAESFYDPNLSQRLDRAGVATVLHVNPELYDPKHSSHWASTYWTPTRWLPNLWPPGTEVVPMPCPTHRYSEPWVESPPRIVHPTARAMADRHGTQDVKTVAPRFHDHGWIVDAVGPGARQVTHYWERDPGATLMVLPRRYGGLSLPVLEAFSAGVPVVMSAIPPNLDWPVVGVKAKRGNDLKMKSGIMPVYNVAPSRLTETVVNLMVDTSRLSQQAKVVYEWAQENSWHNLKPFWLRKLNEARS